MTPYSYQVSLGRNLSECPEYWRNFIREFNSRWDRDPTNLELEPANEEIQHFYSTCEELQTKWRACLNGENWDSSDTLEFETEKDYTMFVLGWL